MDMSNSDCASDVALRVLWLPTNRDGRHPVRKFAERDKTDYCNMADAIDAVLRQWKSVQGCEAPAYCVYSGSDSTLVEIRKDWDDVESVLGLFKIVHTRGHRLLNIARPARMKTTGRVPA